MITFRKEPKHCPFCHYCCDAHRTVGSGQRGPQPGDASICFNCGELLEFGPALELIPITDSLEDQLKAQGSWEEMTRSQHNIQKRGLIRD
jgi:hypothetical protein